jgi:hypothetical protein
VEALAVDVFPAWGAAARAPGLVLLAGGGHQGCPRDRRLASFGQGGRSDARGGRTCACNAHACSRSCHRAKQARGWQLTKPRPGWTQWTTKAGRTYLQGPWRYST